MYNTATLNIQDSIQEPFNDKMLNILFANKVGTSFNGSNDLSLQKFYASIDNKDNSMSFGINLDSRNGDELARLKWVFSGSLKLKSTNNFATIFDEKGVFQKDNLGATYKVSFIGRGIINYNATSKKNRQSAVRNNLKKLYEKYDKKTVDFNKNDLKKFTKDHKDARLFDKTLDGLEKTLEKKQDILYLEMAKDEITFLEENKMYNFLSNKWYSLELYTPFGGVTYNITEDAAIAYKKNRFYNISDNLTANYMRYYSSGKSFFIKGSFAIKNNNTIIANKVQADTFQTSKVATNNNVIVTSEEVHITPYKKFLTKTISIEPALFLISNKLGNFGISPSVEFNLGVYNRINWKLGLPISLKDKEGKASVNLELQYKSIGTLTKTINVFGISTNFLFGDVIN